MGGYVYVPSIGGIGGIIVLPDVTICIPKLNIGLDVCLPVIIPTWIPPTDPLFLTTLISTLMKKPFLEDFKNPPKYFNITGSKNKILVNGSSPDDPNAKWEEFEEPINGTYYLDEWHGDDIAVYRKGNYFFVAQCRSTECENISIWLPESINAKNHKFPTKNYPEGLPDFRGYGFYAHPDNLETDYNKKLTSAWAKVDEKLSMSTVNKLLATIRGCATSFYTHQYYDDNLKVSPGPRLSNPEEKLNKAKEILDPVVDAIKTAGGAVLDAGNGIFVKTPTKMWNALETLWE